MIKIFEQMKLYLMRPRIFKNQEKHMREVLAKPSK
jgi:hypothetical protein